MPDQLIDTGAEFDNIPPALMAHAVDAFGDPAKAHAWLRTPNPVFGNRQPIEIVNTADGVALVQELLTRIDYGIFS